MVECLKARFMYNNFASLTINDLDVSSEATGFEAVNATNDFRSSVWKPTGHFEITTSNNTLYINDGAFKTVMITVGDYATPNLLATEIQTQLNASSSNWSVSYDSDEVFKFTIEHTSSATLRLTQTSNAIWDTIGFTATDDQIGTSLEAQEQRNHTSEYLLFDFGYQADISACILIGNIAEDFKLSSSANVTLRANNVNDFTLPPFSETLNNTRFGSYNYFTTTDDNRYRFWRVEIEDKYNYNGPSGIEIGNVYLGDYVTLAYRNINAGFDMVHNDPSDSSQSESGVLFFDKKTKYWDFSNLSFNYVDPDDKDTVVGLFEILGLTTPFYVSIDPGLAISNLETDLSRYVRFVKEPKYDHQVKDYYNISFALREVI